MEPMEVDENLKDCKENTIKNPLLHEFYTWLRQSNVTWTLTSHTIEDDGTTRLQFFIDQKQSFLINCPANYPEYEDNFFVESSTLLRFWCNSLNEYILDSEKKLFLKDVLEKGLSLYGKETSSTLSSESESDPEEDINDEFLAIEDEVKQNEEWEFKLCRKKKSWRLKEAQIRAANKQPKIGDMFDGAVRDHPKQVFSNSAASGILTNDLVAIMETQNKFGIISEPIDDNIYNWSVFLSKFDPDSNLQKDLVILKQCYGYDYIELELNFTMDLYPFYPPVVKVVRPRLEGSMMLCVASMDILKLSKWAPVRDMLSVLQDIKDFLEVWARLDLNNTRNDIEKFKQGAYLNIENHLLCLAWVSEIPARANIRFPIQFPKSTNTTPPAITSTSTPTTPTTPTTTKTKTSPIKPNMLIALSPKGKIRLGDQKADRMNQNYFPAGTGYSAHAHVDIGWDKKAFLAAKREKDKQIEAVLQLILDELQIEIGTKPKPDCRLAEPAGQIYSSFRTQLDPSAIDSSKETDEIKEHLHDVYCIIEASALIPFLEIKLLSDTFLEICQHTAVYRLIIDIIAEMSKSPRLVPLLWILPGQNLSLYYLLSKLEGKAAVILQNLERTQDSQQGSRLPEYKKSEPIFLDPQESHSQDESDFSQMTQILMNQIWEPQPSFTSSKASASPIVHPSLNAEVDPEGIQAKMNGARQPSSSKGDKNIIEEITVNDKSLAEHHQSVIEEKLARDITLVAKQARSALLQLGIEITEPCQLSEQPKEGKEKPKIVDETLRQIYKEALKDQQMDTCDFNTDGPGQHHYTNKFVKSPLPTSAQMMRIAQELGAMTSSLPLDLGSSIFIRSDDAKCTLLRALIIGPEGTPYAGGCFIFDIWFPSSYPAHAPKVHFCTTGRGTVTFNPNLYPCGTVCLSLLGTWRYGEQWHTTSTLLQVLVSIQSLVLVPEPFFNEPGFEVYLGTETGESRSKSYNKEVIKNTIKFAMLEQIQHPPPEFKEVIHTHFALKGKYILQEIKEYLEKNNNASIARLYSLLKPEIKKLQNQYNKKISDGK